MIVAVIPAKGESGRLPNKNMALVNGRPLIDYSVEIARGSKLIKEIYVSTDSEDIAGYCRKQGLGVIMRGAQLGGETPIIDVYYHAASKLDSSVEYVIGLQPDHPDRTVRLDEVIEFAISKKYDDMFTVDGLGRRNGSIRVMNGDALRKRKLDMLVGTTMDNCTNIHTLQDLKLAQENLLKRK